MPTITVDIKAVGGAQFQRSFEQASQVMGRTFPQAARVAEAQVASMTKALELQSQVLARVKSQAVGAFAAYIGVGAVAQATRSIVQSTNALIGWQNALKAVSPDAQAAAAGMTFVRNEADRLGLSLESMAGQFARFSAATRGTALEGEQTRAIFTAMSEASRVLNLSVDGTEGAFRALEQMVSKGKVQAEELRGQLGERLPGAFRMAAEALGVTTEELNKMLELGQVTAENLLPKLAERLRAVYSAAAVNAANSPAAEFNRLSNALFDLRVAVGESGVMEGLTRGAREATDALRGVVDSGAIDRIASGLGTVATAVGLAFGGRSVAAVANYAASVRESVAETVASAKAAESAAIAKNRLAAAEAMAAGNAYLYAEQQMRSAIGTKSADMAAKELAAARMAQIRANAALVLSEKELAAAQMQSAASANAASVAASKLAAVGKSVFAMVGGWPTVFLAAGYAAYQMWDSMANGSDEANAALRGLNNIIESNERQLQRLRNAANGVDESISDQITAFRDAGNRIYEYEQRIKMLQIASEDQNRATIAGVGAWYAYQVQLKTAEKDLENATAAMDAAMRSSFELAAAQDRNAAANKQSSANLRTLVDGYLRSGATFDEITAKLEAMGLMQDYVNQLFREAPRAAKQAAEGFDKETQAFIDRMKEQAEEVGKTRAQLVLLRAERQAESASSQAAKDAIMEQANALARVIEAEESRRLSLRQSKADMNDAGKAAESYLEKLREEVATYGLSEDAKRRLAMASLALTDAQRAEAEQLTTIIDGHKRLAAALAPAYAALDDLAGGHADLDEQLAQGRDALAGLDRAQIAYNAAVREQNALTAQSLALGPLTAEQQAEHEARLIALRELMNQDYAIAEQQRLADEAKRAAENSARAWEDFAYGLADAVLEGSRGVKDYFKRLLDDLKRQIISSGLMNIFKAIFNVSGSAGGGFVSQLGAMFGGPTFGTILGAAGGASGGVGGSVLTALATAISGGVSSGLMGIGGTLAGMGMGGLGGGLAWAGGSVAANGLLGGLGGSFMTGLGNLFGAGGGALMGIGQMIPAIAAIAGVAAAIQKLSGGKLFGTSYSFDSAGRTLDFSATGASGQDRVTEVRQRSLFRGRRWRDTFSDLPDDVADSIGEFWDAVTASNIAIAGDAARTIGAQIKQEFDKDGNVTSTIVEVIGRQYRESLEEAMTRIAAENVIANIDAMLGTTVTRTAPGTGPGQTGPGGGRGIDGLLPIDTIIKTTQQVGEAFTIAERWRHDAEMLAEGAQFLLLAANDIKAGVGLLGDSGTLTAITDLIEDLQTGSETLSETYARVTGSAALLDQALALSGVQIEGTREHIVRLATAITDAAGGLEQATALWNSYFQNFYSAAELAAFQSQQLRTAAEAAFSAAGLNLDDYTHDLAAFRAAFEAALPTLSAEEIANWLAAADALAAVTASARAIDADIAAGAWEQYLEGLEDGQRAIVELTRYYDDWITSATEAGATAEQLAAIEEQRAVAMGRLLEAAEADYQRMLGQLSDEIDAASMTEYTAAMREINRWTAQTTRELNAAARAAGRQAAAEGDLARVHQVAALRAAQALAQLQAQAQALAGELYGTPLSRIEDQIAALQEAESAASSAIGGFSGAMTDAANAAAEAMGLLLGSYSPLRAVDKLPLALEALARGETDANTVLGIARDVYGSGRAYNEVFEKVMEMAGTTRPSSSGGGGGPVEGSGLSGGVSPQLQALLDERERLLKEEENSRRFMQASQLAEMVAQLSTARGEGFDAIAESLGFGLEQFAEDLRFEGLDDLTEYLSALQAEQLGFAELFDTPTAGDLEIVDAIDGLRDAIYVPEADETAEQERAETLATLRDVRDALRVIAERGVVANEDAATATERVAEGVERLAEILESDGPADAANRRRGG